MLINKNEMLRRIMRKKEWTQKNGERVHIKSMDYFHKMNVLNLLQKRLTENLLTKEMDEVEQTSLECWVIRFKHETKTLDTQALMRAKGVKSLFG